MEVSEILTREKALALLEQHGLKKNVIAHCQAVSEYALKISKQVELAGQHLNCDFIETAALLHDIGRSRTHDITHGIEGAKLLQAYPPYARVCQNHIGGGISPDEAKSLGLPPGNYLPESLEEKIICYADKRIHGNKKASLADTVEKFARRLDREHPTIKRILELHRELSAIIGKELR